MHALKVHATKTHAAKAHASKTHAIKTRLEGSSRVAITLPPVDGPL